MTPSFLPVPSPFTLQGHAAAVWQQAERAELQAQLQADARRLVMPAALRAAQYAAQTAQEAYICLTRVLAHDEDADPQDDLIGDLQELPVNVLDHPEAGFGADFDLDDVDDGTDLREPWTAPQQLSWRDRARTFALTIAVRYDWFAGVECLTDVLARPRWGQLHTTIERLIQSGMTPEEFEMAFTLRALFRDHPELNVTPCRELYRSVYDTPLLRWATALDLARRFPGHDVDLLLTRVVEVCRNYPEHRYVCWSERITLLLEGFPQGVDSDYWLTVLEEE
ncbi:hypothetical protein [Deinococcus detaillensis]|uniref:hypothetical protein n=1 Tax=Deinococcus detaillensis TaxID=2592048 RepID=UPI00163D4937|nr:hypothetical protein [Deinococcus detaillensis]